MSSLLLFEPAYFSHMSREYVGSTPNTSVIVLVSKGMQNQAILFTAGLFF